MATTKQEKAYEELCQFFSAKVDNIGYNIGDLFENVDDFIERIEDVENLEEDYFRFAKDNLDTQICYDGLENYSGQDVYLACEVAAREARFGNFSLFDVYWRLFERDDERNGRKEFKSYRRDLNSLIWACFPDDDED